MKTIILSSNNIQLIYEMTLFMFKEAFSFNNNKYLSDISTKIINQKCNKNVHSIINEGMSNQETIYNIRLKEKDWKTILFFLDINSTVKTRKVLKETFFDKYVRVSNHIFRVNKMSKHDPDWKKEQKQRKLKIKKEISHNIKESLNMNYNLVQKCDPKILSYSLERV